MDEQGNITSKLALLANKEAASYLELKEIELARMRTKGIGPKYIKLSSHKDSIRYRIDDLNAWVATRVVIPTPKIKINRGRPRKKIAIPAPEEG